MRAVGQHAGNLGSEVFDLRLKACLGFFRNASFKKILWDIDVANCDRHHHAHGIVRFAHHAVDAFDVQRNFDFFVDLAFELITAFGEPMQKFDKVTLLMTIPGTILWVLWPDQALIGGILLLLGILHVVRLIRWQGVRTGSEPLLWMLHVSYAFIPAGFIALGVAILSVQPGQAAQHLWMVGAIGGMTLAVMMRATLGHSGRALVANRGTVAVYGALIGAVMARFCAGHIPELTHLSAVFWLLAFGGFLWLYAPMMVRAKAAE